MYFSVQLQIHNSKCQTLIPTVLRTVYLVFVWFRLAPTTKISLFKERKNSNNTPMVGKMVWEQIFSDFCLSMNSGFIKLECSPQARRQKGGSALILIRAMSQLPDRCDRQPTL